MTMIIQLLVASVAVGMTLAQEPPAYKEKLEALRDATDKIEANLLSMEGNIPLLNDSRRHYAEIVNVINYHALKLAWPLSSNIVSPYYQKYYSYINVSAPEAISNPQKVVKEIKKLQKFVYEKANKTIELIDSCILESSVCNVFIEETVNENEYEYGISTAVLLAAGNAASIYNDLNEKFEEVSKNFTAHHFVTSSPEDLEDIVFAVKDVHRALQLVG